MPQFDPSTFSTQIFWLVLTFLALYLVLWKVVLPRISSVLEQRQEKIEDDLGRAEKLKAEAEEVLADYKKSLDEARAGALADLKAAADEMAAVAAERQASFNAELAAKTCVPCKGGVPRLERGAAAEMIVEVEGWTLNDDATRITREYSFKGFGPAKAFADSVADLADGQFHHPEITFGWGYCRVTFQTRKIRGLHENDFIMAAKTNAVYDAQV